MESGSDRITSGFCMTLTKESAPPLSVSFPSRILVVCVHPKVVVRRLCWEIIEDTQHSSNARQTDSYRGLVTLRVEVVAKASDR